MDVRGIRDTWAAREHVVLETYFYNRAPLLKRVLSTIKYEEFKRFKDNLIYTTTSTNFIKM